ncbi:hypothetical protein SLS58_007144 [Diplodia intermedia]|uniref:DUF7730 domain-containing protein n=1 Tax=Diplodia intermedia TaxID=856260 RepID=A0ABR3TKV8_9PEZI
MSARRSARIREIPQVSYQEADSEMSALAVDFEYEDEEGDEDDDEDYDDGSFSPSHAAKKRKRPATATKCQKKQKKAKADIFRWADLPGEIKNMIYEFALVGNGVIEIEAGKVSKRMKHTIRRPRHLEWNGGKKRKPLPLTPLGLGLLLLNKETYAEAAPIFYSQNHFDIGSFRAAYFFLHALRPQTKAWITSIEVWHWAFNKSAWAFPVFDYLIGLPNLQLLDVGIRREKAFYICAFYICAYHWIEAVGKQRGDKYAAIGLIRHITDSQIAELKRLMG